jgi:isopentenyl-diphosphate delta-isomerase
MVYERELQEHAMEEVVLLDEKGQAIGTADKATVHHVRTPLHLAFSCYVFNTNGEVLLTRRAATKRTWPGVWTNSCCGHPLPSETLADAVKRRLFVELSLEIPAVELILPTFRYEASMSNGLRENEMCPVFRATTRLEPKPNPDEVDSYQWIDWPDLLAVVDQAAPQISPWSVDQIRQLRAIGAEPRSWPIAPYADLPPAARL